MRSEIFSLLVFWQLLFMTLFTYHHDKCKQLQFKHNANGDTYWVTHHKNQKVILLSSTSPECQCAAEYSITFFADLAWKCLFTPSKWSLAHLPPKWGAITRSSKGTSLSDFASNDVLMDLILIYYIILEIWLFKTKKNREDGTAAILNLNFIASSTAHK